VTERVSARVIDHCITCSDEGVAMRVLRLDADRGLALCAGGDGAQMTVEVALVDAVAPGDVLLVHAGVALTRLEAAA
jgi:hydrogenase expression/formation protein HypC